MNKIKRLASLLLAMSLGMSMLAACGGLATGSSSQSLTSSQGSESENASESSGEHTCVFNIPKQNGIYHWNVCECGERGELERHDGTATDCESRPVCSTCGREYGEPLGHAYGDVELVNGELVVCCTACDDVKALSECVDFLVPINGNDAPVILQLSDPQLTDVNGAQTKCFQYISETVEATDPDLILVTGDLVYGRFDTNNGQIFKAYVEFMESLGKPWAPVFGNHDNECPMGVNWQCEQLEAAENCLFKQRNLSGNGNYNVGILQNNKLLRVFYMLDSHGCGAASEASKDYIHTGTGFTNDQIRWFTDSMTTLRSVSSTTKFSLACHIQPAFFNDAFNSYEEFDGKMEAGSNALDNPLDLDREDYAKEEDFGYLGAGMKGGWSPLEGAKLEQLKALGVDSFFVGHEHCNSASIVYKGVRLQYGQKSSTYDRYNWVMEDGTIDGGYTMPSGATPLMGGTVFELSVETGEIVNPHIYLCGDPLGLNG